MTPRRPQRHLKKKAAAAVAVGGLLGIIWTWVVDHPELTCRLLVAACEGKVVVEKSAGEATKVPCDQALPAQPFYGQTRPGKNGKCESPLVAINGGCWSEASSNPPCGPLFLYKGKCYAAHFPPPKPLPNSSSPQRP